MRIRSDRRFGFDVDRSSLWSAITQVDRYQAWWPWLRGFDARTFQAGSRWSCTVQAPVPYTLRFDVLLVDVVHEQTVRARVVGDIDGWAELTACDRSGGCELRLVSELRAARRSLRLVSRLARPIAQRGHDWVLDTGVEQFRRAAVQVTAPGDQH